MTSSANPPRARFRRRQYVVNRGFQFKYTLIIAVVGIVIAGTLGYFLYQSIRESTEIVLTSLQANKELDPTGMLAARVEQDDRTKLYTILLGVIAMAAALIVWGLIMTHRVAGPLYIISRYLNEIERGVYPDPRPLRANDELHDFFDAFLAMLNSLKARDAREGAAIREALRVLSEADSGKAPHDAIIEARTHLQDVLKSFPEDETAGDGDGGTAPPA